MFGAETKCLAQWTNPKRQKDCRLPHFSFFSPSYCHHISCHHHKNFSHLRNSIQISLALYIQQQYPCYLINAENTNRVEVDKGKGDTKSEVAFELSLKWDRDHQFYLLVMTITKLPTSFLTDHQRQNIIHSEISSLAGTLHKTKNRFPVIPFSAIGVRFFADVTRVANAILNGVLPELNHQVAIELDPSLKNIKTIKKCTEKMAEKEDRTWVK